MDCTGLALVLQRKWTAATLVLITSTILEALRAWLGILLLKLDRPSEEMLGRDAREERQWNGNVTMDTAADKVSQWHTPSSILLTLFSHVQKVPLCCMPFDLMTLIMFRTLSSGVMMPWTSQGSCIFAMSLLCISTKPRRLPPRWRKQKWYVRSDFSRMHGQQNCVVIFSLQLSSHVADGHIKRRFGGCVGGKPVFTLEKIG